MDHEVVVSEEMLTLIIDRFWETIPPLWQKIKAYIRMVAIEDFAISVEQFHILRHIRKGQGSISLLAKARHISRPAVSQAVDVLVQKGLIRRTQSTQDRRNVRLDLTETGDALLDAIFDNTRRWMMRSFSCLSESEMKTLLLAMDSLKKVVLE